MKKPAHNAVALPVSEWPDPDRDLWLKALDGTSSLLQPDAAANWRNSSTELFQRCYGLWLAWLASKCLLKADETPGKRLTPDLLRDYLLHRRGLGNNARTLVNHVVGLRHMLQALDPESDHAWMLVVVRNLKCAVHSTKKNANLPAIKKLLQFGFHLMNQADYDPALLPRQRALMYRNGLAIAMLACRPFMRRNNLAAIRIGDQLLKEDGGKYRLRFSGDEMKGRRAKGGPLPVEFTAPIERYLAVYRPILLASSSKGGNPSAFWISGLGRPIYAHAFSKELSDLTEAAFGRRVNPHQFRHAAGSSIARDDPSHVGIVATILGHADFRTSERYYILADENAAFERFHDLIDALEADDDAE